MSHLSRLGALTAVALTVIPFAHAQEEEGGPTKNETNLSALQGNFFGKNVVTTANDKFRGRTRIRINVADDGLSAVVKIKGNVKVEGERVPIVNRYRFRPNGRVSIDEIAPAVSNNQSTKGFYTAAPREVSFVGTFRLDAPSGKIEGTYTCRLRISVKRIVRSTYSVTLADDTTPTFVYDFVAEPKDRSEE
jgi:hypothetical protein